MMWHTLLSAGVDEPVKLDVASAYRIINGAPIPGAFVRVKVVYIEKDEVDPSKIKIDPETKQPVTVTIDVDKYLVQSVMVEIPSFGEEEKAMHEQLLKTAKVIAEGYRVLREDKESVEAIAQ